MQKGGYNQGNMLLNVKFIYLHVCKAVVFCEELCHVCETLQLFNGINVVLRYVQHTQRFLSGEIINHR